MITWVTLLLVAITCGVTQTLSVQVLKDLTVYYAAAANLIANTIAGVNGVQGQNIAKKGDRGQLIKELHSVSYSISSLRVRQTPFVASLSDYVDQARLGKLKDDDRKRKWNEIIVSSTSLRDLVSTTLNVVEKSRFLKVALDERDRLALREALLGRSMVLNDIQSLQPPEAPDEIDQMEKMNKYYGQLVKSLGDLNVALLRAIDRLSSPQ